MFEFGNAQDPQIADCAICEKPVPHPDKFVVEREISELLLFFPLVKKFQFHALPPF